MLLRFPKIITVIIPNKSFSLYLFTLSRLLQKTSQTERWIYNAQSEYYSKNGATHFRVAPYGIR